MVYYSFLAGDIVRHSEGSAETGTMSNLSLRAHLLGSHTALLRKVSLILPGPCLYNMKKGALTVHLKLKPQCQISNAQWLPFHSSRVREGVVRGSLLEHQTISLGSCPWRKLGDSRRQPPKPPETARKLRHLLRRRHNFCRVFNVSQPFWAYF